jgi:hypothetical protein
LGGIWGNTSISLEIVVTRLVNLSHDYRGARIDFGHDVALPILEKCPTKNMLINHIFWHYEENLAAIAEAGKRMPIHAVADGEVVEL